MASYSLVSTEYIYLVLAKGTTVVQCFFPFSGEVSNSTN